jgi:hypothetical protein
MVRPVPILVADGLPCRMHRISFDIRPS